MKSQSQDQNQTYGLEKSYLLLGEPIGARLPEWHVPRETKAQAWDLNLRCGPVGRDLM